MINKKIITKVALALTITTMGTMITPDLVKANTFESTNIENVQDLNLETMTLEQQDSFYKILDEYLQDVNPSDRDAYREAFIGLFSPSSENFNDLDSTTNLINKNKLTRFRVCSIDTLGVAIDLVIGVAIGGISGGIQAYINKKGKEAAKKIFVKTTKDKLMQFGASSKFATKAGVFVEVAMAFSKIGDYVAGKIDTIDKIPYSKSFEI